MFRGAISRRCYAAGAQVAKKAEDAVSKSAASHSELKLTTMPNQMTVSSIQSSDARSSALTVAIKAGSRYESNEQKGMAHRVALIAGMSTTKDNQFGISLRLASMGAHVEWKHTRDNIVVTLNTTQEHRDEALALLGEMVCEPSLNMWELTPSAEQLVLQQQKRYQQTSVRLDEMIHQAAYRSRGLGHNLYCDPSMAGYHDRDAIGAYLDERFTSGNTALMGINMDHDEMLEYSQDFIPLLESPNKKARGDIEGSPYDGGEEHVVTTNHISHALIAGPGASWQDLKGRAANAVLLSAVAANSAVPWYGNCHGGLARKAIKSKLGQDSGWGVVGYNEVHSDSGIIGLRVSAPSAHIRDVALSALEPLKAISTGTLAEEDLEAARNRCLVAALIASEDAQALAETSVSQCLSGPNFATPADLAEAIGQVSKADVQAAAKKLLDSKPSLATLGDAYTAPYLDNIWKA